MSKKAKMLTIMLAVIFIVYNVVLFVAAGFRGHTANFWVSWTFMTTAFVLLAGVAFFLKQKGVFMKDWIFGYPLLKYSVIYLVCEIILSTLFIILDAFFTLPWAITFIPQLVLLGVYVVLLLSCLIAKETADEVTKKVKANISFMRILESDARVLVTISTSEETQKAFEKFYENVKFSDPVSNDALADLEANIFSTVSQAKKMLKNGNEIEALDLCNKATLLLTERNEKCKILK